MQRSNCIEIIICTIVIVQDSHMQRCDCTETVICTVMIVLRQSYAAMQWY